MDNTKNDAGSTSKRTITFREWASSLNLAPSSWSRFKSGGTAKPKGGLYLMMLREKNRTGNPADN